jgi:uncharacterized sulfatase
MNMPYLCLLMLAVIPLGGLLANNPADPRPNVLFIICDDMGTDLGAYGNDQVISPHIDRLARESIRFTNAYAQFPSCLPSRLSFLSGWSIPRIGVRDFNFRPRQGPLAEAVYLPEWFKRNGYTTIRIDKVFHPGGDEPSAWTVSEEPVQLTTGRMLVNWLGIELQTLGLDGQHDIYDKKTKKWTNPLLEAGLFEAVNGEKGWYNILHNAVPNTMLFDGNTAVRAGQYLKKFAKSKEPFFLTLGFRRPHVPFTAPQRYYDLYPPESIELPPPQPGYTKPFSELIHRRMLQAYYAVTTFVDAQIGIVINTLTETGLDKNTIVVLIGDHGYCLGERDGWFGKKNFWDHSLRTVMILKTPEKLRRGEAEDSPVGLTDLYPTLVDLADLPRPPIPLDGYSLKDLMQGTESERPNYVVSHNYLEGWDGVHGSIRTSRWRYMEHGDGTRELYDALVDPYHWNNLAADPQYKDLINQLSGKIKESFSVSTD